MNLPLPSRLLVVTDRHGSLRPLAETVRAVLEGGARWIWFRDRDMEPAARHDMAAALLAIAREAGARLSVGGDAALAAAVGADGAHLGGTADPAFRPDGSPGSDPERPASAVAVPALLARVTAVRRLLGDAHLVGLSAHSLAECRAAARANADYATLSPVFATASKPGYGPALGFDALHAAAEIGLPVLALGGVGPEEARACRAAGAAGVAVMGGLMHAPDPAKRTRALLDALA